MKTSESLKFIAPALLMAQKKIGSAKKDAKNPFFKSNYADLGSVMEACKEALNDHGISVLQPVGTDELGVYVETLLLHESGEFISDRIVIAVKEQNNPQAQGSAITYARRYGLQSMVFIPAEDDDAEAATNHKSQPKQNNEDIQVDDEDVVREPLCEKCGMPAEDRRGTTKVGNKPYHGIFCTSGIKQHTKWIND